MRNENAVETATACWDELGIRSAPPREIATLPPHSLARLVHVVEAEIVPRLVLVQRRSRIEAVPPASEAPAAQGAEIVEFTRLLLMHDAQFAFAYIQALANQGVSPQCLCLQYFAPAARRLGELWERDECNFLQVTHGLCKLHQVLHRFTSAMRTAEERNLHDPSRRVLLASIPGEQHTFGVVMVGQFFRAAGWDVWNEFPESVADLAALSRTSWYAIVGLSVASDVRLSGIADTVGEIRRCSRNRSVSVMLGGPAFVRRPSLAAEFGADATATDGREAAAVAQALFASQSKPT